MPTYEERLTLLEREQVLAAAQRRRHSELLDAHETAWVQHAARVTDSRQPLRRGLARA